MRCKLKSVLSYQMLNIWSFKYLTWNMMALMHAWTRKVSSIIGFLYTGLQPVRFPVIHLAVGVYNSRYSWFNSSWEKSWPFQFILRFIFASNAFMKSLRVHSESEIFVQPVLDVWIIVYASIWIYIKRRFKKTFTNSVMLAFVHYLVMSSRLRGVSFYVMQACLHNIPVLVLMRSIDAR